MNTNRCQIEYTDKSGAFRLKDPGNIHELYFPLCNHAGLMSSITPTLHGDIKTGQHHFITAPVTVEDLHNTRSARNFWIYIKGVGAWSACGNSARQNSMKFTDGDTARLTVEAGPLWHKVLYEDPCVNIASEILNFAPANGDKVEIMIVNLRNDGVYPVTFTPTSAIPLFGRSAENIRDHRHVTSLLNRLEKLHNGICMKPEIVFDERGHRYNHVLYYVLGSEDDGSAPLGSIPSAHDFIGEAGSYEWPEAVVRNFGVDRYEGGRLDGKEYVGALRFRDCTLAPGESKAYVLLVGTCDNPAVIGEILEKYGSLGKALASLSENRDYWTKLSGRITFESGLDNFSCWMRWVGLQPVFRKIYGCSFLPYHDYGKGGRGWRDLWQDCLSLILLNPSEVRTMLIDNFAGVRVDGTNATIIGTGQGEFIADRNNIARVWMDHGAWPYLTARLYIDQSGDFKLLFEKRGYFRDALVMRAQQKDEGWSPEKGLMQTCFDGSVYDGTIFEHLLVQHLVSFFNVGEHNIIRLEGADWNDTLDMARQRGESTAFTALYGSNLIGLSELIQKAGEASGFAVIELFEELLQLVDTLVGSPDYDSIAYKRTLLDSYLKKVSHGLSGKKASIDINTLAGDLWKKGEWIFDHIRRQEWLETSEKDRFFNGYYNNDGASVDGQHPDAVRMNLTGQVFTTMFGLASEEQVRSGYLSCQKYLKDPVTGGYRLNTPLGPNQLNFGRGFAFSYGDKENGATFCHMAVMYMNALYRRHFVREAYDVFNSLFRLSVNTPVSGIYPGIPEYFNADGKGLYHYLTGSASWLLLTALTEMYGVRGQYGDLIIEPKLVPEQFDGQGEAAVKTTFGGSNVSVKYRNPDKLEYDQYRIEKAFVNGIEYDGSYNNGSFVKIPVSGHQRPDGGLDIQITLGRKI